MEKTIFLFKRHQQRSRENFAHHYIRNHAPLGAKLTRSLLGYTVNLVSDDNGPDAITEHWIHQATDLLTPATAYASAEDFQAVVDDDRSLFDGFADLYVAVKETYPVPGDPFDTPLAVRTPGVKLIWFYGDASDAPPPPKAAWRVVDNWIGYKLVFSESGREKVPSDINLIRMAWGPRVEAFGAEAEHAIIVSEYRFIAPTQWDIKSRDSGEF